MAGSKKLAYSVRGASGDNFTVSLDQDRRLWRAELTVSRVHVQMLAKQGIITAEIATRLIKGLESIGQEIAADRFKWRPELEDIHINVEARMEELVGADAHHLQTARSRNDQVATVTRLVAMGTCSTVLGELKNLCAVLAELAQGHTRTAMPGYTHLQRGQPVVLGHHLLAYWEMFARDRTRFQAAYQEADVLVLGSGALGGANYPIDRNFVARELGFSKLSANSMDAVADRDYLASFIFGATLCMAHLSRLAEELVLWSSAEFNFVNLAPEHTTGSSMMPQKRNPDYAELVRGRSGRVYGALVNLLTVIKGLPLTYNRDLQEDKQPFLQAADTLLECLPAVAAMLKQAHFNRDRMLEAVEQSGALATDFADYLVRKGVPFREAYTVIKKMVSDLADVKGRITDLNISKLRGYCELFDEDVLELGIRQSLEARHTEGGTAPKTVAKRLDVIKAEMRQW